ncbi:hypothetical protein ACILE2_11095 [Capnocytophaga canimorsus]|uniref:hypothetical protein n=1 Tax=Capnocytophaga canimorsus TaxID=28188 RepID=UPI0037CDBC19
MKSKYNIGDEVFVYDNWSVKKQKIDCIIIDKDGISYIMDDEPFYIDGFPKDEAMIATSIDELEEKIVLMKINEREIEVRKEVQDSIKEYKKTNS